MAGEDDWERHWNASPVREELIAAIGDAQLARRIYFGVGDHALAWLDEAAPALEGRTPRQCLRTKAGRAALRTVVARFPL